MKLLHWIAALLVLAVLSVDGLVVTAGLLALLALGGLIHSFWPSSALFFGLAVVGLLGAAAVLAFIVIPLVMDFEDDDGSYPGS